MGKGRGRGCRGCTTFPVGACRVDVVLPKDHGPWVVPYQVVHRGDPKVVEPLLDAPERQHDENCSGAKCPAAHVRRLDPSALKKSKSSPSRPCRVGRSRLEVPGVALDVAPLDDGPPMNALRAWRRHWFPTCASTYIPSSVWSVRGKIKWRGLGRVNKIFTLIQNLFHHGTRPMQSRDTLQGPHQNLGRMPGQGRSNAATNPECTDAHQQSNPNKKNGCDSNMIPNATEAKLNFGDEKTFREVLEDARLQPRPELPVRRRGRADPGHRGRHNADALMIADHERPRTAAGSLILRPKRTTVRRTLSSGTLVPTRRRPRPRQATAPRPNSTWSASRPSKTTCASLTLINYPNSTPTKTILASKLHALP